MAAKHSKNNVRRRKQSCSLCGKKTKDGVTLSTHHIFHGRNYKPVSERYGWVITLCLDCHKAVHGSAVLDKYVQKTAQRIYEEKRGDRELFIEQFNKSWLTEKDDEEAKREQRLKHALINMVKELEKQND